jgi:hypothetical protein
MPACRSNDQCALRLRLAADVGKIDRIIDVCTRSLRAGPDVHYIERTPSLYVGAHVEQRSRATNDGAGRSVCLIRIHLRYDELVIGLRRMHGRD